MSDIDKSNSSNSSMKGMIASKDWMPKYAGEHQDIDYKDMLKSDFADGVKSTSEASVAAALPSSSSAVKTAGPSDNSDIMAEFLQKIGVPTGNTNASSSSPRVKLPSYSIPLTRASRSRQSSQASTTAGRISALPSFDLMPLTRSRSRQSSVTSPPGPLSSDTTPFKMSVDLNFDALTSRPRTRSISRQSSLSSSTNKTRLAGSNDNFKMSVDLGSLGLSVDPLMSIGRASVDSTSSGGLGVLTTTAAAVANKGEQGLSLGTAVQQIMAQKELIKAEEAAAAAATRQQTQRMQKPKRKRPPRRPKVPEIKDYVEPRDNDVLLGRGGRSNHHVGNKFYRTKTEEMRDEYRAAKKEDKTAISQRLVNWVLETQKANFLALDEETNKWYIIQDNTQRRRKASQALREHMTMEEREARKRKR